MSKPIRYNLNLVADVELLRSIEPLDFENLPVSFKLRCEWCGDLTENVRICSDEFMEHEGETVNFAKKCALCPDRHGIVKVVEVAGAQIHHEQTHTLMSIEVSEMCPVEEGFQLEFGWKATDLHLNTTSEFDIVPDGMNGELVGQVKWGPGDGRHGRVIIRPCFVRLD